MENLTGVIFNIVHGSFVDGYGVRTTVFLKGCPLSCLWCCNPEGQKVQPELRFHAAACNGCLDCVAACPAGAVSASGSGIAIDRALCTDCGQCVDACCTGALEITGQRMSLKEVMEIILKDEHFYRQSGGGVTIGGGEATYQPEFTLALVRECRKNYIHTAIDTCGYTLSEKGLAALEEADLLLFDIKGLIREKHVEGTGVDNEIILKNLRRLDSLKKSIIIRIPLIPGYNDSEENIASTAELLGSLTSVERVDIIPFHEYGKIKYDELGKQYKLSHLNTGMISQETLCRIQQVFADRGLQVQVGG